MTSQKAISNIMKKVAMPIRPRISDDDRDAARASQKVQIWPGGDFKTFVQANLALVTSNTRNIKRVTTKITINLVHPLVKAVSDAVDVAAAAVAVIAVALVAALLAVSVAVHRLVAALHVARAAATAVATRAVAATIAAVPVAAPGKLALYIKTLFYHLLKPSRWRQGRRRRQRWPRSSSSASCSRCCCCCPSRIKGIKEKLTELSIEKNKQTTLLIIYF